MNSKRLNYQGILKELDYNVFRKILIVMFLEKTLLSLIQADKNHLKLFSLGIEHNGLWLICIQYQVHLWIG